VPVTAVVAALLAACSFATAAILQQEAAQSADPTQALHVRLLLDLLGRPRWVAGISMLVLGFLLQAIALANGPVALVQPIVATELAFAIPIAIWRRHRRPDSREWAGIAFVISGVSVFLAAASPVAGITQPSGADWLLVLVPAGGAVALAVLLARARRDSRRATLLGVAAGVSFALLAVLTKAVTHQLGQGVGGTFRSWQIYLLVGLGILALVVSQSAYQAGPLALSMPAIATVEPVVAVVLGDTLFEEQARLGGAALALEASAALVALVGLAMLATSPIVLGIYEQGQARAGRSGSSGGGGGRAAASPPVGVPPSSRDRSATPPRR
jgi:drug/metabolite transporter (DMT)-like permease